MARIRCNYVDCIFLENQLCGAATVELDPDEGCMTYTPIGQVGVDVEENWDDEELEELRDGQWVRVYGKLHQLPTGLSKPKVQVKGIISKSLNRFHGLAAVKVEEIEPPAIPYMFEFRRTEPYAY